MVRNTTHYQGNENGFGTEVGVILDGRSTVHGTQCKVRGRHPFVRVEC